MKSVHSLFVIPVVFDTIKDRSGHVPINPLVHDHAVMELHCFKYSRRTLKCAHNLQEMNSSACLFDQFGTKIEACLLQDFCYVVYYILAPKTSVYLIKHCHKPSLTRVLACQVL